MSKLTQTTIEAGTSAAPVIRTMQGSRPCHREHNKHNTAQGYRLLTEIGSVSASFEFLTQTDFNKPIPFSGVQPNVAIHKLTVRPQICECIKILVTRNGFDTGHMHLKITLLRVILTMTCQKSHVDITLVVYCQARAVIY